MPKKFTEINFEGQVGVDPYFYSYDDRESLVIIRFVSLNEEMVDRYTGKHLNRPDFTKSVALTSFDSCFCQEAANSGWDAVRAYLGVAGTAFMLGEMLAILSMELKEDIKTENVFNSTIFQKMSRDCHAYYDGNGKFLEYGRRFYAFLKRHKIA